MFQVVSVPREEWKSRLLYRPCNHGAALVNAKPQSPGLSLEDLKLKPRTLKRPADVHLWRDRGCCAHMALGEAEEWKFPNTKATQQQ